ncbi:MAG: DUF1156 domain-containing protein [Candidatus Diapherotrites archaeon]
MTENTYKKKLIEVALPLDLINEASSKEKSIRQGHPSTMHIWWARRTLAASRAVLFSSLVDDPSVYCSSVKEANKERKRIFKIVTELVQWKTENKRELKKKISELINNSTDNSPPPILDPFSGGGTIPYAAQNLGLDGYGIDLNPVAVMVGKGLVEIPPLFYGKPPICKQNIFEGAWTGTKGLAEDIRYFGKLLKEQACSKIGKYYTDDTTDGKTVIAWLWCHTVKCQNPACRFEIPLITNSKLSENCFIRPHYEEKKLKFKLAKKSSLFGNATKEGRGSNFKCINCGQISSDEYIKNEGKMKNLKNRLMAAVIEEKKGFGFREVTDAEEQNALSCSPNWEPLQEINKTTGNLIRASGYGINKWSDLFLPRQLLALTTFSDLINDLIKELIDKSNILDKTHLRDYGKGDLAYIEAICVYLTFALDRCANYWSASTFWGGSFIVQTFRRQTVSIVWDYTEVNPFSNSTGNWDGAIDWVAKVLENIDSHSKGEIKNLDSSKTLDFNELKPLISTDPPYYDNIDYAELSDYFYVWMRPLLSSIYPDIFATLLTPKSQELIAAPHRFDGDKEKAKEHFLNNMSACFTLIRKKINEDFPLTVYYAYKQTETDDNSHGEKELSSTGWETMLTSLIAAGFKVVGTWPMRTERFQGFKSGKNYLASSVVIVCRPRNENAPIATRREFLSSLKKELPSALKNLQDADIAPVDLAQSAIGPGMAIFSRFSKVLEADGSPMSVRTALQLINQELSGFLSAQESDWDKETRFCIAWFEQFGWSDAPFGDANTLAQAKGTAVNGLERVGVVLARGGRVRLVKREDLSSEWDPLLDKHLTVWECVQHLIRILEEKGETEAAKILNKLGGLKETVKELAYALYAICEKKGWSEEGLAYNALISSWQSITDKAQFGEKTSAKTKQDLKDKSQKKLFESG